MKKRIISLMLTVSMLISMFSLGIHASAAESGVPGSDVVGASVNDDATMHQIYWTRSVEYSPWLTADSSEVTPEKPYNPAATDYAAATGNYLTDNAAAMSNEYILNMGRGTTRLEGDGYVGSDPISDLEETLNDERMRIAYVDPYFQNLSSKADLAMNTADYEEYIRLYNKIVEAVRATRIDPTTGTGTNQALLADPVKNALEADEVTRFTALQEKRYANLSKSDAAMLKLYESDYNKAPADKLIYDETYIWDGGYCPTADDGSTTNTALGTEPTTKVGLGNHADIPVYAGWGVLPTIDSTEEKPYVVIGTNESSFQGATSARDNTFYYVNLATLEEGVYDSIPTGVYFKYNDKYYQATADIQGFGSWHLDKAQEITDADVIAELTAKGPNKYPAPAAVTDFALNTTTLNLDVKVRGEGSFKNTVISYDSAYIALGGVTPANNADMDKVTVEYSIVNGGDYITLGTPSTTNPYAVKVTANQNIASDATAQVACTFKYDGTELGTKYVTVNVTRTIQNQTYNAQYGLYCRGLTGELGNNSTELRLGNTASVGQWATWMSFINDGRTFSGPVEGLRRFTGYVYLSENEFRSGNTLYFSALDDILIAGDDSFSIVVNGVPFFRADIALHNNYENDEGVKFEDNRTEIVKTCQTCGTSCSIYSEDKRDLYRYGGATGMGPWHAHIDTSTVYEATSYLHPGANRIDIIGGDVAQGGGMSRLYLYSSETSPFNGKLSVKVQVYSDPSCADEYEITAPIPVGTQVYYKYTVTNTGTDPVYNVVVRDPTIGVRYESDKYEHNDGVGPYGKDPYNTGNADSQYTDTTNTYTDKTSTITTSEMGQLAELAKLDPGEANAKSIVITTKYSGASVTDWGASIIGETVGTVINTVYAYADDVPEVQDTANVTFFDNDKPIVDDYAVIDYGLPITVPVLDNDNVTTVSAMGAKAGGFDVTEESDPHNFGKGSDAGCSISGITGTYGTAEIKDNKFRYVPTKIVNDIDTFTYYVSNSDGIANAMVTIVPASSVYYEDSMSISPENVTGDELKDAYLSGKPVFVGNWTVEGKTLDKEQSYDNDAHYGYDTAYDVALQNDDLYSLGSSHRFGIKPSYTYEGVTYGYADLIHSDLDMETKRLIMQEIMKDYNKNSCGYVTFAFEGTGFDIISRCSDDSGIMKATVYKVSDMSNATIADNGEIQGVTAVKSLSVNQVKEGDEFAQEQIPTMTIKNLAHDNYVVQIKVTNAINMYSNGTYIWVDAIRIYDPLGSNDDIATINKYYVNAERLSTTYKVRDLILNDTNYGDGKDDYLNGATRTGTNGNLVYYLPSEFLVDNGTYKLEDDENAEDKSATAKYAKLGPKSEIYLQKYGDGFAFTFDARNASDASGITLQIDAKLIESAKSANGAGLKVTNTATGSSKTVYVKSGTQMFYDFTDLIGIIDENGTKYKGGTFVVQNVSANDIIAVTNMKIPSNTEGSPVLSRNINTPDTVVITGKSSMYPKTTQQLTATISPSDAIYSEVKWTSNSEYVTVDANGNVTAPEENNGVAYDVTITATVGEISADFVITILPTPTSVSEITLTADKQTVHVGDVITISSVVNPSNATDKSLTWSVSDKSLATINAEATTDSSATITANAIGTFDVIATAQDGSGVTGKVTITVEKIDVTDVTITVPATCTVGDVLETTVAVTPENATNKDNYTWVSSDSTVIAVTRDNKLQAIKDGTATVYVNVVDGDNTVKSNEITVTVNKPDVTKINLTSSDITVNVGEVVPMPAFTIEPVAASYLSNDVYMTTTADTDGTVVKYDSASGKFIAAENLTANDSTTLCLAYNNADGTVVTSSPFTVNVKTVQATFQKVIIRVNKGASDSTAHIIVDGKQTDKVYDTATSVDFTVEFTGESVACSVYSNSYGSWNPDDQTAAVMNISNGGAIEYSTKVIKTGATATSEYKVEYFAKTIENGIEVPIYIVTKEATENTTTFVPIKETGILINNGAASVDVPLNGSAQLTTKFQPINASYKDVTWSTSDGNVARVDENGVVYGIGAGTAVITVRTTNANKTDTIIVNVSDIPMENMEIADKNVVLYPGDSKQMSVVYTPAVNSYEGVAWSVTGTGVTIDAQTGMLTVAEDANAGTYTVTATTTNRTEPIVKSVEITVKQPVESVSVLLQYNDGYNGYYYTTTNVPNVNGTSPSGSLSADNSITITRDTTTYIAILTEQYYNQFDSNTRIVKLTSDKTGALTYEVQAISGQSWTKATDSYYTVEYNSTLEKFVINRVTTNNTDIAGKVEQGEVKPTAVKEITPTTADIMGSSTVKLTAVANQGAFEGCSYTWSSSNPAVATFADANDSTLTIVGKGTTNITVTIIGGNVEGTITKTVEFVVTGPSSIKLSCDTVNPNDNVTVQDKETFTLFAKYDTGADAQNVTWSSSDNGIATVTNGVVTFTKTKFGPVTITATSGDFTAEFTVTAYNKVNKQVLINGSTTATATMTAGATQTFDITFEPIGQYEILDETFEPAATNATVTKGTGATKQIIVTPTTAGTAKVTVTSGSYTATLNITVTEPVYTATVAITSANKVQVGKPLNLEATVTTDAPDKTVTWSIVSGSEYATLDGATLTGVAAGTVKVRATSNAVESAYAEMDITVEAASSSGGTPSYDSSKTYVKGNAVEYNGVYYLAYNPAAGFTPDAPGSGWYALTVDPSDTSQIPQYDKTKAYSSGDLFLIDGEVYAVTWPGITNTVVDAWFSTYCEKVTFPA